MVLFWNLGRGGGEEIWCLGFVNNCKCFLLMSGINGTDICTFSHHVFISAFLSEGCNLHLQVLKLCKERIQVTLSFCSYVVFVTCEKPKSKFNLDLAVLKS